MTRPKVLITRHLPDAVMAEAGRLADIHVLDAAKGLTAAEARDALASFDGIVSSHGDDFSVPAFDLDRPRCKILANFGAGIDHIDPGAARACGVLVTNTPDTVTDATADIGILLMLMTCRRAGEGERLLRRGDWTGWKPTQMLGTHVTGKTLGIIGMGRIGKAVAKRAHLGFGMEIVFFNRSKVPDLGFPARQLETLEQVLGGADVVVIALPSTPLTWHLIGAEQLAAMKPTAYLVNIARGDIVDESALVVALEAGQIAGAGLDVYEFEPKVSEGLLALENVALLPHLGTAALDVREAMGRMALENLRAGLEGRPVPNPV
ncbi:D-glycerate dehydrogenase [Tropicimonas sp. IMCC34043]|uniref:2-hydroxyacid dehydrogenase n=1 Tax=Tropicimonas sp. IMCC34043 TaxID=2248760 RepID=UPI000E27F7E0|nr:D-glycerate dehydrogenase [Tropicimonas sp. IMCC34043]